MSLGAAGAGTTSPVSEAAAAGSEAVGDAALTCLFGRPVMAMRLLPPNLPPPEPPDEPELVGGAAGAAAPPAADEATGAADEATGAAEPALLLLLLLPPGDDDPEEPPVEGEEVLFVLPEPDPDPDPEPEEPPAITWGPGIWYDDRDW